jgi:hypothetical protein
MQICNKTGWKVFIYSLLYPGVLGSMIFDILDPMRPWVEIKIALIAIAVMFSMDFLHMKVDLKHKHNNGVLLLTDALIAILFSIAYFLLAQTTVYESRICSPTCTQCLLSLAFLAVTHLCIVFYEVPPTQTLVKRDFFRLLPFYICLIAICGVAFSDALGSKLVSSRVTIIGDLSSSIAYGIFVFFVYKSEGEIKMTNEKFQKRLNEAKEHCLNTEGKENLLLELFNEVMSTKENICQIKRLKKIAIVNAELFEKGLSNRFWLVILENLGIPSTSDDKPDSKAAFSILHSRIMNELQWRHSMIKSDRAFAMSLISCTIALISCVTAMLAAVASIISACK